MKDLVELLAKLVAALLIGLLVMWMATEAYFRLSDRFAFWTLLGKPTDQAIEIVGLIPNWRSTSDGVSEVSVVVKASDGTRYIRHPNSDAWSVLGEADDQVQSQESCTTQYDRPLVENAISNLPRPMRSCHRFSWTFEWVRDDTYVVQGADGQVWLWHYHSGIDAAMPYACVGGIVGFVGVLVVFWQLGTERTASKPPEPSAAT